MVAQPTPFGEGQRSLTKSSTKSILPQMGQVGVHEAKTTLSQLLRRVAAGEEVTITRGGEPVAKLVPVAPRRRRLLGQDRGAYTVPDEFDAPLPEDLLRDFEG